MGNQKQQGQEVFSTFSGIVASMSIEPEMGEIAAKTVRTPQEQTKLQGICSTYFFYRNSVKQFTDLLAITLDFVLLESGEHKERFLRLLISQLSEQEIMAYGILNHRVVGKELEERLFVSTLQFGGIKNMAEKSEFVSSKMVP